MHEQPNSANAGVTVLGDINRSLRSNVAMRTLTPRPKRDVVRWVAAIYIRYSTLGQGERSETRQSGLGADYANRLEASVYKTYVDRGLTGTTMSNRSGFNDLLSDAAAGRFNLLIVERLDRVSRAMTDLQSVYRRLVNLDVEIHEINGTRIDNISLLFKGMQAVEDRTKMLERTSGGRKLAILSGRVLSRPRYGYVANGNQPGDRAIHPDRAAVIVQIYMDYDAGLEPGEIAATLDGLVPTPQQCVDQDAVASGRIQSKRKKFNSPRWTEAMVISILRCPLYCGQVIDRTTKATKNARGDVIGLRARPEEDHVIGKLPDRLVIVDPDLARRVTERNEARYAAGERAASSATYLLTGRLVCGVCEAKLVSYAQNRHRRYMCSGERDGSCRGIGRPRAAALERVVIDGLVSLMRSPDVDGRYRPAYRTALETQIGILESKRDRIAAELQHVDAQLAAARASAPGLGFSVQTIASFCSELEETRANAALRLSLLRVPTLDPSTPSVPAPGLDEALACLASSLPLRSRDLQTRRLMSALRAYVERVKVRPASATGHQEIILDVSLCRLLGERERAGVTTVALDLLA